MHVTSGVKLAFQEQTVACPVVAGFVASHAAY